MAVYKVPQDVEAEDKLLGPFSFKQFIFLIIAIAALAGAYALSTVLLPLALLPLPIALFFGALALPLRKDQPMEVYLAAVISFITKPKIRMWRPDGIERMIEVTAPPVTEKVYGKGFSQEEVNRRLSYLANLVDSHGWSVRGVADPNSSMRADLFHEAQAVTDELGDDGARSQAIDDLLAQNDQRRRQEIMQRMQQGGVTPPTPQPLPITPEPAAKPPLEEPLPQLTVNPYPHMQQSVIRPLSDRPTDPAPVAPATSEEAVSPAIIDLANNHNDLSIETLQREAQRIREKEAKEAEDEVIISLR